MRRFGIITPTIPGREAYLQRCIDSIRRQDIAKPTDDYLHIVCADGFQPEIIDAPNIVLRRTAEKTGGWGNEIRNRMIQEFADQVEYFLFVDDDNIILPGLLTKLALFNTDVIITKMLMTNRLEVQGDPGQKIIPPAFASIGINEVGSLNFCIRSSIARQCKWPPNLYCGDFQFFSDCLRKSGNSHLWKVALLDKSKTTYIDEILSVWCRLGV